MYVVTLAWEPPGANEDGSPLTDLAGYRVYEGPTAGDYSSEVDVGMATEFSSGPIEEGVHHFAVTAYDGFGNESPYSEITVAVPGSS